MAVVRTLTNVLTLTATKTGVCKVTAEVAAVPGYLAYSHLFMSRVK